MRKVLPLPHIEPQPSGGCGCTNNVDPHHWDCDASAAITWVSDYDVVWWGLSRSLYRLSRWVLRAASWAEARARRFDA